jgi:PAS domain S-box-containing protein
MDLLSYKAIFQFSPFPYLILDTELVILGASGAYLRSVKRTEVELVGKHIFEAFPSNPGDPDSTNLGEVKASIDRALLKRLPDTTPILRYSVPVENHGAETFEERYWSAVHTPVLADTGEPMFVIQNAIDVTSLYERNNESNSLTLRLAPFTLKQAEDFNQAQMHEALSRVLNNEREHLRSLFDQAPGFVAVLMGPKHVFELANKAYYQLVGHREIIGKTVWEALPEVAGQGFEEFLHSVYTTGVPWSTCGMPIAVQRERGGPIIQRYVDLVYQPYRNESGDTIGIFAQGYDVTESVEAQAAKRESDERLKEGLEAAKMIVWDWNFETGDLVYSDNIVRVLGYEPSTMNSAINFVHPDDRQIISAAHMRALAGEGSYQIIIRIMRPDNGKQIWVDSRGRVRYDLQGEPTGIRGVTIDVTERQQAELGLRETNQRKDEFLAMLAHELRNPLSPIASAAEVLKLVVQDNPKLTRVSEVISRQTQHMSALVDDLLDASRVTRGIVQLDKEILSVKSIANSAVEQSSPLFHAKNQSLLIRRDASNPKVHGDRIRLVQVITNLLNNAAKYTPENGEIVLSIATRDSRVCIEVTDNGVGMSKELLPHVFELFTQAERTPDRSQGGLGIGLALVRTMVTLHGGEVSAESAGLARGSKFTILLPTAK